MGDAAVEFLLQNLKQLLVYNVTLIRDVKNQVELLYNDLGLFKAFLKDASQKRRDNEVINELVKQIRGLVYEAEDAIDTFVTEAAVHKARSSANKVVRSLDYKENLRKVAEEIKTIRVKVKEIYDGKKFGFEFLQVVESSAGSSIEKKPPIVEEDNVVGFDDEAKTVISFLTEGSEELEVISVVGMPGLGKTTLARMIYRDPKIGFEFYQRAWVYVSQDYSKKEVLLNILGKLIQLNEEHRQMNDDDLGKKLHDLLENGKYLIVMDDVWTVPAWDDFKAYFPKNNKRSRILITTRMEDVAKHANPGKEPHRLSFLNPANSWKLLQLKALGNENCPEELISVGMRIANECKGLPLAIVVIGGILLEKGTDWWQKVAESVNAYMDLDRLNRMKNLIGLSYNHLPYHLKSCFVYVGMFPEDFEIPVWNLICLWIAEGFIQYESGMSLEDVGEEYLAELVSRNLLMAGGRRSNGKLKTCRIHDMLRDFCKTEARNENFYEEIQFRFGSYNSSNPALQTYRRLSIHSNVMSYISGKPVGPRVRSFVSFSGEEIVLPAEYVASIPGAFKLLRVIHGQSIIFSKFPTDIVNLIHLRYIYISCNFKMLPAAMSGLWNIQTFIVETSSRTFDFKADIWRLNQLRHVKTNASTKLPGPLSKSRKDEVLMLGNLQTLSMISPESCTEDVFASAPNLKNVGIRGSLAKLLENKGGSILFDGLGKLGNLEKLKLLNDVFPKPPSAGKLAGLPQGYKFPSKLKNLTLSDTLLDWKDMSILGKLDNLEILKLKNNAFKGDMWQAEDGGFRSLKVLHIGRNDLVTWHAMAHHFPRLRQIVLRHCSKLSSLPSTFAEISSLQLIDLYCTTPTAASSARDIKASSSARELKLVIYPPS